MAPPADEPRAGVLPHPDDRPPEPGGRRRAPAGLWWAMALAVVVIAVMAWQALGADGPGSNDELVRLRDPARAALAAPPLGSAPQVEGTPAPAVSWRGFDGEQVALDELSGAPTLVNFWSSTCAPCVTEMPEIEQVHRHYGDRLAVVGLAVADGDEAARQMAARTGVTYPLGFDPRGEVLTALGGIALPTTVLLTPDGTIANVHTGALTAEQLRERIDRELAP